MTRRMKISLGVIVTLLVLVAAAALWLRGLLVASLPLTDGEVEVTFLESPVTIDRDGFGVPLIRGESFPDVAGALGFLHAQERFFQMDLSRRRSAGELSALFGPDALSSDIDMRALRLRALATRVLEERPEEHRQVIATYTRGVNAGLEALSGKPPEYVLLAADPVPWRDEDSILVIFTMFDLLAQDAYFEGGVTALAASLPDELVSFLTPEFTRFDAPLLEEPEPPAPLPVPGPDVIDVRSRKASGDDGALGFPPDPEIPGSNNFAVAGKRSEHGGAIVANDMHLPLGVPNVWYRAQLEWGDRRCAGVTLAGLPTIVAGSNGHVSWGFTNVCGDFQDWVVVEVDPEDEDRYLTPDGPEPFTEFTETIEVQGSEAEEKTYRQTRWGAVSRLDPKDRPLVLKWTATEKGGVNFALLDLLTADTLEEALPVVERWRGPPQNVLLADRSGRIAWMISGYLPKRVGMDGKVSVSWAKPGVGWEGEIEHWLRPRLVDPPSGILFSANQRTVPATSSGLFGRAWAPGFRAARIRERLLEKETFSEEDLLSVQLDVRSRAHDFYRDLFLECAEGETDGWVREMAEIVRGWNGEAAVDQAGFRLLRELRRRVHRQLLSPLVADCPDLPRGFVYQWPSIEETVRRIFDERPLHLLPAEFADYPDLVRAAARSLMKDLSEVPEEFGPRAPWGKAHRPLIAHPFSGFVPVLAGWLDMEQVALPGDTFCVRVQGPTFGASERFVVSPGKEEKGFLHMPGGQSGHFLSEHYSSSHEAWVKGRSTAFLAGEGATRLVLKNISN